MIGDMGRTNRGLCLQSPDTSDASGLYDIWYRSGTSGEDFCDWSRVGIGSICDGRVGQRLAWDVAIDAESEDFYASAFSTSPPPDPFAPAPCSPRSLESRSAVLAFSSDAEDCNDNCIDDALELADPATDCDLDGNLDECQIRDDAELDRNLDGILDACQCLADVNGDGVVNQEDIDEVLQWIEDNLEDPTCFGCPEDINGDGLVDILISWRSISTLSLPMIALLTAVLPIGVHHGSHSPRPNPRWGPVRGGIGRRQNCWTCTGLKLLTLDSKFRNHKVWMVAYCTIDSARSQSPITA